jgi:hypothetical protein
MRAMMMSCGRSKEPFLRRCSTMREARAGPMAGKRFNSSIDAVLLLMRYSLWCWEIEAAAGGVMQMSAKLKMKSTVIVARRGSQFFSSYTSIMTRSSARFPFNSDSLFAEDSA